MKKMIVMAFIFFFILKMNSIGEDENKMKKYVDILYSLGSIPLNDISNLSNKDGIDQINGWISPDWIMNYLSDDNPLKEKILKQKKKYSYHEYISFLDINEYKKSKDSLLYAIMCFVLENMYFEKIRVERTNDIIKIYKEPIGLEEKAIPLLKDNISIEDLINLFNEFNDKRLIAIFPIPKKNQIEYINFLERSILKVNDVYDKYSLINLLYLMDNLKYKEKLRNFIIKNLKNIEFWYNKMIMYYSLIDIFDKESIKFIKQSLLEDPITECREGILYKLQDEKKYNRDIINTVLALYKNKGKKHKAVTASREENRWEKSIKGYLLFIYNNFDLDGELKSKLEGIINN